MIEIKHNPTPREIAIFGLLWLLFFAGLGAIALWRPEALWVAVSFMGVATLIAWVGHPGERARQLVGLVLPTLLASVAGAVAGGVAS